GRRDARVRRPRVRQTSQTPCVACRVGTGARRVEAVGSDSGRRHTPPVRPGLRSDPRVDRYTGKAVVPGAALVPLSDGGDAPRMGFVPKSGPLRNFSFPFLTQRVP